MASNTDDTDDEYLDDPISLMFIDDIKKESEEDEIIEIQTSSDEEEPYTSSYGKKNFVLPVTFFDNIRNIRLLNKCKPLSISIVDCKQYPKYYSKSVEKNDSKCDHINSSVETGDTYKDDSKNKPNSADAQNVVIDTSNTPFEADKRQEGENKLHGPRKDSFYEKLERRKENKKQIALKCKDLSQVDFKRNTGLVGLKITDTIFKQICITEKTALLRTNNSIDNKTKECTEISAEEHTGKNNSTEEKLEYTFESDVEEALAVKRVENKPKEHKSSDTGKEPVVTKRVDCAKDKLKEKKGFIDKPLVENQCKRNIEENREQILSKIRITSGKDESNENSKSMYIKEVGAVLDNLGTTIVPVTDRNSNNGASNKLAVTDNNENKSTKTNKDSAAVKEKSKNNHDIKLKCSLKIPSKKIVEKVLKLKETKALSKSSPDMSKNTIVQQTPKETLTKSKTVLSFNISSSKSSIDGSIGVSEKDKMQYKNEDTHIAVSGEMKQVEKLPAKEAGIKNHTSSNSPVIPCTTLVFRAGSLKSTQNTPSPKNTTQNPKNSLPPINSVHNKNATQKSSQITKIYSGHNAIIFRMPTHPPRNVVNNVPQTQGQPIQTVINHRPQFQPMLHGSPMRFRLPSPCPPPPYYRPLPNYPPPPNYSSRLPNFGQIGPNHTFIPPSSMPIAHLRGIGMGLNRLRFPGPSAPDFRPRLPVPPRQDNVQMNLEPQAGQQSQQVKENSFIGITANGDPIIKINIPHLATEIVNDKQLMLAELNSAMTAPELIANKPEEKPSNVLKRKADPKIIEPVKPKYSKPCPLSRKNNVVTDINKQKEENRPANVGYSAPIKPILTYAESFQMFGYNNASNTSGRSNNKHNRSPAKMKCTANIIKLGNKEKKSTHTDSGKERPKKISFEDYTKRAKDCAGRIDVDKIRKYNEFKYVTDDYNQDLGYDSDSTVKL